MKAKMMGSGWHKESLRHSNARRLGRAGGTYKIHPATVKKLQIQEEKKQFEKSKNLNYVNFKLRKINKQIKKEKPYDELGNIIAYEQGELNDAKTLELFSHLIKNGKAWTLQGHYGRTATALIQDGWLDKKGNITKKAEENGIIVDSDGDGVPDKYDCQPHNPKAQDTFTLPEGYTLETRTKQTRSGTREISVLLKDGKEISEGDYFWSNRPWQSYTYDISSKHAIDNSDLSQEVKDKLKKSLEETHMAKFEESKREMKSLGLLAEIFSVDKKQANENKVKLLKAKYGKALDIPEDFESLSEEEKEHRLNLATGLAHPENKYSFRDLDTGKDIHVLASNPDEAIRKMNLKAGKKVNYTFIKKETE